MGPQVCLFWPALLLLASTSSSAYTIRCSKYDSDYNSEKVNCNAPSEYCGIDRTTGAVQGCVPASQCPTNVADNRMIVCDASKPSCCCLDSGNGGGIECNDILHPNDASQWTQACGISLLQSPADVCKVNPTRRVYCAFYGYNPNYDQSGECRPYEFCGIAKSDGEMKKCIPPKECPTSGAKGSKQVVCDGTATHCCCQDVVERSGEASTRPCNYILNEDDSTIWQQACSLKELSPLSVCQEDPSKQVYCKKGTDPGRVGCKPSQFCGIDKNTGELKECLDASQCSSSVSEQISCDPSKPFCCCQNVEGKHGRASPCNDMLNPRDNTIWNQACSLIELAFLPICKEDPTKGVFCTNNGDGGLSACKPSEFCGIDKTEGKLKQCLDVGECPAGAGGSDIVCDDNAPNCCCKNVVYNNDIDLDSCNNIFDQDDHRIWEQACEQEQLKNLPICQHDPTKKAVYCKHDDGEINYKGCPPFQFCGIRKSSGKVKGCLFADECPAGAGSSEKIVCDDSAPNCCCQKIDDKSRYSFEEQPTCNNILDLENTTIWKQACALEQLKDLEVCKAPPTKPTFRPYPKPKPGEINHIHEEEHELHGWEIALIVISVLIVLAVIVCVVFIFYKKRRRNVVGQGGAVQGQQQIPSNAQLGAQQQQVGSYYPAQQGFNLQASQSAPLVPVNPAYQNPYAMSMPNMRYY